MKGDRQVKYEITVQTFFRNKTGVEFVKGDKRYEMSNEQFECWVRQAQIMGFRVMMDNELFVCLSRVENKIEVFLNKING